MTAKADRNNSSGQVLLLVLLSMAAIATMALSVVSRSISGVGVTSRDEESLRAFSAAEAGVEQALVTGTQEDIVNSGGIPIDQTFSAPDGSSFVSSFSANVERYPVNPTKFNYPFELNNGESGSVWLATKSGDQILPCPGADCFSGSQLSLCWGKPSTPASELPAVMVNILYISSAGAFSGQYATRTIGYDPNATRALTNSFEPTQAGRTIDGQAYARCANINFGTLGIVGYPVLMRVTSLYNTNSAQIFGVDAGSNLPIQGRKVTSTGVSGESSRKIDAFLLNPEVPFVFDAAVYSGGGLVK